MNRFLVLAGLIVLTLPLAAQRPDLDFINQEIANEIQRLQQLFGPGPTKVTGSLGPMANGGACTLQIVVTDVKSGLSYTYTVPYIDDDKCKNYILEQEQDGSFKVVPKPGLGGITPQDLADFQNVLKYFFGGGIAAPHASVLTEPAPPQAPRLEPQAAATSFPTVLALPFAPPLSAGQNITSANGCDPAATYLLFRVNHFDDSVTRYDGCPPQITATIPIAADGPLQAALTPDAKTLVVTSYNQGITFIDTATNKVIQTLVTSGSAYPSGIAIRRDGQLAYVTSLIDTQPAVLAVDVVNRKVLGTIPIPAAYPHSVYFSPDGLTALVTCPLTNYVFVIDVLTSTVSTAVQIGDPRDVAFNPTGTRAYVSSGIFPASIKVVDTSTYQVIDTYKVDGYPGYIEVSKDGRYLTVKDLNSTNQWSIDLATRNVIKQDVHIAGGGLTNLP